MWFRITSYIRFLLKSTNEHGVHSPFIFSLVTKCFYDRTEYPEYEALSKFRAKLLQNDREIHVTDFGAGSKVFRSNRRKIVDIAKNAGISERRARLLLRIVRYFQPGEILEIGTSVGLATSALSLGNPDGKVVSLEGCPETASVAKSQFQAFGMDNVDVITGVFSAEKLTDSGKPGLVFFDGNHTKKATLAYFEALLPNAFNDDIWIFDDIHWSEDMEKAWEIIRRHPKVTATIDTWQWGIVFFRKEQSKEHFVVRTMTLPVKIRFWRLRN